MRARLFTPENRRWWTLAAVSFGLFMILLDNTIVNVALPAMQQALDLRTSELEWVVVGYTLSFATFMLTGGKLADLLGRRLLFVVGLIIFSGASLACGLAGSASVLIGARVVQGVGAALISPATLGIITATFPPRERGTAIGIWAGTSASGLAIGPLVGGVLTEKFNWSWIFYINVPVGIVAIAMAFWAIDESRDTSKEQRLDLPGLLTSGAGLFALTYGLIEANNYGWTSVRILALFGAAVVLLTVFVVLESRLRLPMLDLALFRNATFSGANVATLLVAFALFGIFFYNSLFIQNVLGYSPIQTGAVFLPMTLLIILIAPRAGKLTDSIGARWLIGSGLALVAVSMLLFAQLDRGSNFWNILPGLLVGGTGIALTMTPATTAAMGSVPVDRAGVGSAVLNSSRQIGGSLGLAIMGAVVARAIHVPPDSGAYAGEFVSGYHHALYTAAGVALVGALVAAAAVRRPGAQGVIAPIQQARPSPAASGPTHQ